jgi:hypothetical protein
VQGRAATNGLAERARALFRADADLSRAYNEELTGGKWRHFMDQTHIGYTYWQQPVRNALPAVTELQLPATAGLGVAVEGRAVAWPTDDPNESAPALPPIDVFADQRRVIEVFNRGTTPFAFTARTGVPWLRVTPEEGEIAEQTRLTLSADWERAPVGRHEALVTIEGPPGQRVGVRVPVFRPAAPSAQEIGGFIESDGHVSIEAAHFTRAVEADDMRWQTLADFGRTLSGVTSFPVTSESIVLGPNTPRLEYAVDLFSTGDVTVDLITAPTLAFVPGRGLRCAVSFDEEAPQVVEVQANRTPVEWERSVIDAVAHTATHHRIAAPGAHVLKLWMVDPGVVLEKIVIDAGGVRPSSLGPPESVRGAAATAFVR